MHKGAGWGTIWSCLGVITIAVLIVGCRTPQTISHNSPSAMIATRNNAASLLYDLMGDEANVSKLLIIKRERDELHRVIKTISTNADAAHKALTRSTKEDPSLDLKQANLPPGEKATREAISKQKAGELLRASGADFEFKLLLTQAEALAYAEHLASVAALNETSPERAEMFRKIATRMNHSHGEVLNLLRTTGANRSR